MRSQKIAFYIKSILIFILVVCLSFLAGFLLKRHSERQQQLAIMESFEDQIKLLSDSDHDYTGAKKQIDYLPGQTMAILSCERLDIKVSVAEGIGRDTLRISAGHFPDTALPGEGNFSIAGHSSLVYTCLFNKLREAELGDVITVQTHDDLLTYVIDDIQVVNPDDVWVLEDTDESILTIVTCTNSGKNRLILRASEVR